MSKGKRGDQKQRRMAETKREQVWEKVLPRVPSTLTGMAADQLITLFFHIFVK